MAAATVNWSAKTYNGLTDASGVALPTGNLLEIGTFLNGTTPLTDAQIQTAFNNGTLSNFFKLFGSGTIGGLAPGYFSLQSNGFTDSVGISGRQIYILAFNSGSVGTATQEGIFYLNAATSGKSTWLFPSDSANPSLTGVDLADLTGAASGAGSNNLITGADVVIGAFGPATLSPTAGIQNAKAFELAPIPTPEPASAGLALLGGVALLIRRRRSA